MKNCSLKKKLNNNQFTLGSWITIGHPSVAEILCQHPFDWLTIDIEHNTIDLSMMQALIATIQSYNIAALVRVWANEESVIKHALDAGADGIIVPMVNNSQDAMKAVSFAKYPPQGCRGVGLSRAQRYGKGFGDYKAWVQGCCVVIAQVEHIEGIENLDSIITTPGVDGVMIGPYDLSGSLGHPGEFDRQEVKDALQCFEQACDQHGIARGYHVVQPDLDLLNDLKKRDYSFIAYSTDFMFMDNTIKIHLDKIPR